MSIDPPRRNRVADARTFARVLGAATLVACACAGPSRAGIAESPALHPLAVPADPFLSGPSGGLTGPAAAGTARAGRDRKTTPDAPSADPGGPGAVGGSGATPPATVPSSGAPEVAGTLSTAATLVSMVPARGDARTEIVASSTRLLGISGSFDDRSFLGHILRVNDLLPAGATAASYPAAEHLRRAKSAGLLRPVEGARVGDLLFYQCPSGCGAGAADGLAAGVVESSEGGVASVVAYQGGEVRRCRAGTGRVSGERVLEGVIGVVDPWALLVGTSTRR